MLLNENAQDIGRKMALSYLQQASDANLQKVICYHQMSIGKTLAFLICLCMTCWLKIGSNIVFEF